MYTTKERNEIYKRAYLKVESGRIEFICNALPLSEFACDIKHSFPEFELIMPELWNGWCALNGEMSDLWFNEKEYTYYESDFNAKILRLNILSFCIAMTEQ